MAKEFDIYLNKRLTECDILVYSIPFRDGLTVVDRLVLESSLESYLLQKFVATQTGSALISHIDEMIKTCYERLNMGAAIDVNASFKVHNAEYPETSKIVLGANDLQQMATMFAAAENTIRLITPPVRSTLKKPSGRIGTSLEADTSIRETLKNSLITAHPTIVFDSDVTATQKRSTLRAESSLTPAAYLTDLCYRVYGASTLAIQLAAIVTETELHYSLGYGENIVEFDADILSANMRKLELFQNALSLLISASEKITQFVFPGGSSIRMGLSVSPIVKRYRLLYEIDQHTLSGYDTMTLEETDYVIL